MKKLKLSKLGLFALALLFLKTSSCQQEELENAKDLLSSLSNLGLATPENEAENVSVTPTLTWEINGYKPEKDTLKYDVYLGEKEELEESDIISPNQTDTTYTVETPLENEKTYYWQIEVKAGDNLAFKSSVYSFTTAKATTNPDEKEEEKTEEEKTEEEKTEEEDLVPTTPEMIKPTLSTPENEATISGFKPTLTWTENPSKPENENLTYDLYIGTEEATLTKKNENPIAGLSYALEGLEPETYYWQVEAKTTDGVTSKSEVYSFTNVRIEPTLTSPTNNSIDASNTTTLTWTENASKPENENLTYDLYVGTEETTLTKKNENPIADLSYDLEDLVNGFTYYWQVEAKNTDEVKGRSAIFSFTVGPLKLPSPTYPENEVDRVELRPTLTWEKNTDNPEDIVYDVYLDTQNPPTKKVSEGQTGTTYEVPEDLELNTKYYWKIVIRNPNGGDFAETNPQTFTTGIKTDKSFISTWHTHKKNWYTTPEGYTPTTIYLPTDQVYRNVQTEANYDF